MIPQVKYQKNFGTYTTQAYGESSNSNIKYDNSSSSMSLISRKLLTPDEVLRIENPYVLVMTAGKPPAICYIPDISKMHFNRLNGMGTKEENQKLRIERENKRKVRPISKTKIWDIWNRLSQDIVEDEEDFSNEDLEKMRNKLRSNSRKETVVSGKNKK